MAIRRDKPTALRVLDAGRAIQVMADALGRDSRRELVELVVGAWVDAIPEHELAANYAKALAGLKPDDLRDVAGWPGTAGVAVALANREFLLSAFAGLGDARRETLRCAAALRAVAAFDAGVSEVQVLGTVLPCLSAGRLRALAEECSGLYLSDRLGGEN
ncbi:MAG TPA: hypothetical protein VHM72_03730 [Solirubrobacteraceae bacterium]|nr:hypothetical protein [Solirubrobacteraceae bacterium]